MPTKPPQRDTICVEQAEILANDAVGAGQHVLRLQAPQTAAAAAPGNFVHIRCQPSLRMRRPMSIMRAAADAGWVEVLYKCVGKGTALLAEQPAGASLSIMGPIGRPFEPDSSRPRQLLIGGGVGMPPMIFLVERLRGKDSPYRPLVLLGSEIPFPFTPRPSEIMVEGIAPGTIACMPLMDDWGIPSRLASLTGYPGCFEGYVTDLAREWLDTLSTSARVEVQIHACGPTPMLKATAKLAADYALPSQLALEEYMACAVGGCAGCAVRVRTDQGIAMKRVCVDGPVFPGDAIVWGD